jgi:ABC-type transport system involved in multi-copper enzyme maturation permease subunit
MNATLAIASRELGEKRFVFAAAVAFAVLTLLFPLIPGIQASPTEIIFGASAIMTNFVLGLAALLGASVIGRDLSEGRLSFYFARPVPASAIWFGKLLASGVLIGASFAIIIAPAAVISLMNLPHGWGGNGAGMLLVMAGLSTLLFFGAHVIGTMVRSRSAWVVADFVLSLLAGLLGWLIVRPLIVGMPPASLRVMLIAAVLGLLFAFIGAGAWQLARGRTDRVRNHVEMSRFLWSSAGVMLALAGAFALWVFSATPRDITADIEGQRAGSWLMVSGQVRARGDYHTSFLVNTEDGRYVRMSGPGWFGSTISRDGRMAAWLNPISLRHNLFELMTCKLDVPHPKAEASGVTTTWWDIALSPDGSRALLRTSETYSVYDLQSRRSIGSFSVPRDGNGWTHAYFEDRDHVRAFFLPTRIGGNRPAINVFDFDVRSRALRRSGSVDDIVRQPNHNRTRFVTDHTVYDAATLAPIVSINGVRNLRFLDDDTLVAIEVRNGEVFVRHLSASGAPLGEIAVGRSASAWLAGTSGTRAFVELLNGGVQNVASVDLARGVVERMDGEIRRIVRGGASNEVLCITAHGVIAWNPATGDKRVVAGRTSS